MWLTLEAGLNQHISMWEKNISMIILNGFVSFLFYLAANDMTLHLSKQQSIFIHAIIIWQLDEMFVFIF